MSKKMQALLRNGPAKVCLGEVDYPVPGKGEVVLAKIRCGPCGSDWSRYMGTDTKDKPGYDQYPLGHEMGGTVVSVGEGVDAEIIGKQFVICPLIPCHMCKDCDSGAYGNCPNYSFIGSRSGGGFAEAVLAPAINLLPLPEGADIRTAAFVEPLAVVLHPFFVTGYMGENGPVRKIKTAVVTGLGPIGLLAVAALNYIGAKRIVVSDVVPFKLELAKKVGATDLVDAKKQKLSDVVDAADLVFEASGSTTARQAVREVCRPLGQIFYVGKPHQEEHHSPKELELPMRKQLSEFHSWMSHEHGPWRGSECLWPGRSWFAAIDLLAEGAINVMPLVTHEVALVDSVDVFQAVLDGSLTGFGKILVSS